MKLAIFVLTLIICLKGRGQNEFFFGHYMFNPSYFNPSWAGSKNEAFISLNYRTQWAGYNTALDPGGAPTTQMISFVAPIERSLSGVALFLVNDQSGPLSAVQIRLAISSSKEFGFGKLTLGLMPALNSATVNANYYRFDDPDDPLISTTSQTQNRLNAHVGVLFESKSNFFVSASVENLLAPRFSFGTEANMKKERNYSVFAGIEKAINQNLILKPFLLVRSDFNTFNFEISAIAEYRNKMWGGLSFRDEESMTILLGYSFLTDNKLKLGYSFDYIVRNKKAKESTSHEIFIRYNLPNLVFGGKKPVKTPRFSF